MLFSVIRIRILMYLMTCLPTPLAEHGSSDGLFTHTPLRQCGSTDGLFLLLLLLLHTYNCLFLLGTENAMGGGGGGGAWVLCQYVILFQLWLYFENLHIWPMNQNDQRLEFQQIQYYLPDIQKYLQRDMCGFSYYQHYCFTRTALRLNKNLFCSIAFPSRSCGLISLQY